MSNLSVNAIRFLGIDAIEKSKSGHPGVVMGAAPMAYDLFTKQMRINPEVPNWINRDRFVLSAGHGSMLLYALLHLSGFKDVTMEEIKNFRQWGSKTPGHPEFGHTAGVDATTGPLGQGISMATGFAQAERFLAAKYNREGYNIFNHYTYVICGDGDLMEGVSAEAASYAGLQKLDKLIVLYDSNDINLDGETKDSFTESVRDRYNAYGWHTALVKDGTDLEAINAAIEAAKVSGKPSLIEVKTVIGYGSPNKQGTNAVHGAPLGAEEVAATRKALAWDYAPFEIPEEVYEDYRVNVAERGKAAYDVWEKLVEEYKQAYPDLADEVAAIIAGKDPVEIKPEDFPVKETGLSQATRNSSQDALNAAAKVLPTFLGGSADLAHSNMTYIKEDGLQDDAHRLNRNIQFGVREFAMGTILNGMALHGGLRVYGGTFFVFSDYVKAAVRLSALQGLPVTYVFTHDSIAVGEDGPTHEPIEHLAGLRAIPNLTVFRPADARETQAAWYLALKSKTTPTALVLTRQNLTVEAETDFNKVAKGAYVVYETVGGFDTILLASGSEVNLAVAAAKELEVQGEKVRVVSVPSTDIFDAQDVAYKEEILPNAVRRRVAIEMAATQSWYKYVGLDGSVIGIDKFGASAPAAKVMKEYGFTVEHIVEVVKNLK
ncbi:transketolase [Streptococcus constellatus subsp. pharyngis]|uniref:Transketolase n=1 Tax=Streptococcus constellatus subsp. pharyngis SK1060 = CCUG 46377 TaxID=1035184 RepID=F9P7Y7_STRCV|nr:transketolase [Streptococcus constellatus]AGU73464.1 putative transketolase [Streptococcus constellatus subsp. pharyngis C232]AGU75218.1 putative transketolase [Streptococcus constellatus subsp. pharyngis C818]AGU80609.1 putative transketolase [Streptococcus constellatus subsp. pharyngis C1050]EGV08408.1 transketolase [Streptococcus constellatus subsp. pharyngis SK1060 = CCUG 46377]QQC22593.1 transketolase [Streptococcus constellatus]